MYSILENKNGVKILESSKIEYEFRTTIIKEFHTIDDIKEILSLINSNSKYYIQNFQNGDGVIKKGLQGFTNEELINFKKELTKFPNALIRNI
jgi:anaerobic ribonucleoside-triphosphate reductase